jgi:hypothetical protein
MIAHSARRQCKQAAGEFLGRFGVKLRGVSVGKLIGLFCHRLAYLGNAVANRHDRGSAGGVEIALASRCKDKAPFAANGLRIRLQEISRKDGVTHCLILDSMAPTRCCAAQPATAFTIGRTGIKDYSKARRAERIHNGE